MADSGLHLGSPSPEIGGAPASLSARPIDSLRLIHLKAGRGAAAIADRLDLPAATAATDKAAWLGPGEWLLFDYGGDWSAALIAARGIGTLAWSDASDMFCALDLGDARPLLGRLTGLVPTSFEAGRTVRTCLAGIRVTLLGRPDGVWLLFERSYAVHLRCWLDTAL